MSAPAWDGARNLIDLGGVPLADGAVTASGRVFRSAAREWMTEDGWAAAREAGLSCVVDLRNAVEVGRREQHPVVPESAWAGVTVVAAPTEDPDDEDFLAECGPWLDHPRSWTPNLRRFPAKFARVMTAIAEADGAVLVHCAGGKDRTGLVCSMLLRLAGADVEAVVAAYEAGFRGAVGPGVGFGLGYDAATRTWVEFEQGGVSAEELDAMIADRLPALRTWVAECDVAGYLRTSGVSDSVIDRLTRMLRE